MKGQTRPPLLLITYITRKISSVVISNKEVLIEKTDYMQHRAAQLVLNSSPEVIFLTSRQTFTVIWSVLGDINTIHLFALSNITHVT